LPGAIRTEGSHYFAFLLVGMVTMQFLTSALNTLPGAIGSGIGSRMLEAVLTLSAFLGGVYYPTSVIPSWVQDIFHLYPADVRFARHALRPHGEHAEPLLSGGAGERRRNCLIRAPAPRYSDRGVGPRISTIGDSSDCAAACNRAGVSWSNSISGDTVPVRRSWRASSRARASGEFSASSRVPR
jgi:hypothetical protein